MVSISESCDTKHILIVISQTNGKSEEETINRVFWPAGEEYGGESTILQKTLYDQTSILKIFSLMQIPIRTQSMTKASQKCFVAYDSTILGIKELLTPDYFSGRNDLSKSELWNS